ncbi:MAG: bifunctional 2-polyprenyl-6-hydroxyphenol methylase/3-demethylubiquinol 3-O-methyltransferase UbiG [Desulfobacterales bacterium]|nr:MAG: bifunctional 2-polyprenyl-6-hydroxyphenol methylase/3-demethylubiquinol 3-O-methyltransferase UbiG [Desulfobacterales bacterium]
MDEAEIAKFESLAPVWWDKKGPFKALHDINALRVNYINTRAPLTDRQVLDVGCGGGILSEAMAALGARVTGIDMGAAPLMVAKRHAQATGLSVAYRRITVEKLAQTRANGFDIVACLELLEHVPNPASVIEACHTLVRPGGDIFLATLNRNLKSFLFAIVGAEYLLGLVRKGTHSYRRFLKPQEIESWANQVGSNLRDLTGLHYNPFRRKYSLGGNTHVNYLMHFQKPR